MKKIMILGDTHADMEHIHKAARKAKISGVTDIYQLGDFGYTLSPQWIEKLCNTMGQYGVVMHWIDGNHDNHETIANWNIQPGHSRWLGDYVEYLPRGYRFEIEGVKFLAMGGAFSIDIDARVEGVSYWRGETIQYSQARAAAEGGNVDIILSHDAPYGGPLEPMLFDSGHKYDEASKSNRKLLRAVVDATNPKLVLHGHFHYQYDGMLDNGTTRIVGFDMNGTGIKSWGFLTLHDGEWSG